MKVLRVLEIIAGVIGVIVGALIVVGQVIWHFGALLWFLFGTWLFFAAFTAIRGRS